MYVAVHISYIYISYICIYIHISHTHTHTIDSTSLVEPWLMHIAGNTQYVCGILFLLNYGYLFPFYSYVSYIQMS